jgi:hypothetical protein
VSQTASDVKRGHWEVTVSCFEALAQAKAEATKTLEPAAAEVEAPIAQATTTATKQTLIAPKAPVAITAAAPTAVAPTASGINGEEPPNRGDNARGRMEPTTAPKKLMLSLVAVKRISSDIPASNFDRNELDCRRVKSDARRFRNSASSSSGQQRIQNYQRAVRVDVRITAMHLSFRTGRATFAASGS